MEVISKISRLRSAPEDITMDTAESYLNGCSMTGIPYTLINKATATMTIKLVGSINSINEFKNRFTVYDCRRHFKWEDING
jgi:hypothetical protein